MPVFLRISQFADQFLSFLFVANSKGHTSAFCKKFISRNAGCTTAAEDENIRLFGGNPLLLNGAQHAQTIRNVADHAAIANFHCVDCTTS